MKFIQFTYKDKPEDIRVGYLEGACVMDINARDSCIPKTMVEFLSNDYYLKRIQGMKKDRPCCVTNLKSINLKPPIHGMDKVLCSAVNFYDYCDTCRLKPPLHPGFYSKFPSAIIGPSDPIVIRTDITQKLDWEAELCVVIGKKATCVAPEDAYDCVFGYTIAQDLTARDWTGHDKNLGNVILAKSMDTFCPLGPCIVTKDELGDPHNLEIICMLNGACKQKSNTNQMIHQVPKLIERVTSVLTLLPGDIILTGTPAGVGMSSSPPEFLKPGDILRSEIEKIGVMEHKVTKFIKPQDWL